MFKTKAGVFKVLRFEERFRFREGLVWTVGRNKASFSSFSFLLLTSPVMDLSLCHATYAPALHEREDGQAGLKLLQRFKFLPLAQTRAKE